MVKRWLELAVGIFAFIYPGFLPAEIIPQKTSLKSFFPIAIGPTERCSYTSSAEMTCNFGGGVPSETSFKEHFSQRLTNPTASSFSFGFFVRWEDGKSIWIGSYDKNKNDFPLLMSCHQAALAAKQSFQIFKISVEIPIAELTPELVQNWDKDPDLIIQLADKELMKITCSVSTPTSQ